MRADAGNNGQSKSGPLSLADEVAAWRSKRTLRHGSAAGRVQVVRISRRGAAPIRRATDRPFSAARP